MLLRVVGGRYLKYSLDNTARKQYKITMRIRKQQQQQQQQQLCNNNNNNNNNNITHIGS